MHTGGRHCRGRGTGGGQQHPDWAYPELKGALTASTKPGPYNPFQQGSGRIAVDRAIAQTVVADPVSVSVGVRQWPHTDPDGTYSAYLLATGGGQTVRTAAAVEREVASYDVTVKHLGRDGRPALYAESTLCRFGAGNGNPFLDLRVVDGTAKTRVPKGTYVVNSTLYNDPDDVTKGADWIARPKVSVTRNTSLTFDARQAKPVKVTVPDAKAKSRLFSPDYAVASKNDGVCFGWLTESPTGIRTLHSGPKITDGSLAQHWSGTWTKGAITAFPSLPTQEGGWAFSVDQGLRGTRTLYVSTADKASWSFTFNQPGPVDSDGWPTYEADFQVGGEARYKPGKSYTKTVNTAVFGPLVNKEFGIVRDGNELTGALPLLADGRGNPGGMLLSSAKTVLSRNGKKMLPVSTVRFTPAVGADGRATAGRTVSVPVEVHGAAAGRNLKSLKTYVSYNDGKTWKKVTVKKGKITVKNPAKGKAISFAAKVADKEGSTSSVRIYSAYLGK